MIVEMMENNLVRSDTICEKLSSYHSNINTVNRIILHWWEDNSTLLRGLCHLYLGTLSGIT